VGAAKTQQGRDSDRLAADARVTALLSRHGPALIRVAKQASLCHDDAMDALQRALEIFVRRMETVDRATEAAWLKVVVRHEAYAIRKARGDCVADPDLDLETVIAAPERSVEEQVLSGDRVSRSAEALRALKPDEARALMLKAHGLSYEEIGRHCGWTYTKVNRCITEGRRRFMEVYAELESGDTCERFAPALQALAAGAATSRQLVELRPHLRTCIACRATVRDLHLSRLRRVPLWAPGPLVGWLWERFGRGPSPSATTPSPPASPRPVVGDQLHAIGRVKQDVTQLLQRPATSEVATGIQLAAASGGGRSIATVGAIVGLCLSGIGAGTVCVVRGVVPGILESKPAHVARPHHKGPSPGAEAARSLSTELSAVRATPTPLATREPVVRRRQQATPKRSRQPTPAEDPAQGRTPTSHEHAPISPAPPATTSDFTPAAASGSGSQAPPAAAPATGGDEFGP
jgi:RNA polymerase sigma factor (sigma-70 family)